MRTGGILLCGGAGTRLFPTTKYVNKHLIPVYDKPMVYYSLSILLLCGIKNITIVCNKNETAIFEKLLGNGEEFGVEIIYTEQDSPKGIPDAISKALEVNSTPRLIGPGCIINIFLSNSSNNFRLTPYTIEYSLKEGK